MRTPLFVCFLFIASISCLLAFEDERVRGKINDLHYENNNNDSNFQKLFSRSKPRNPTRRLDEENKEDAEEETKNTQEEDEPADEMRSIQNNDHDVLTSSDEEDDDDYAGTGEENLEEEAENSQEGASKSNKNYSKIPVGTSRIIGGSDAGLNEYPFFVSWNGCAASLVAPDVILSAAHCNNIQSTTVFVGQSRRLADNTNGIRRTIVARRPHPRYSTANPSNKNDYDILLMKLDRPVDPTFYQPIELNNEFEIPRDNQELTVIGFGRTSPPSSSGNTDGPVLALQKVDVDVVPHPECNVNYGGSRIKEDIMLCANARAKDSCSGDSGGPLFYKRLNGGVSEARSMDGNSKDPQSESYVQVGIVSWGRGCAILKFPGVYSRISAAYDWLRETICELSDEDLDYCPEVDEVDDDDDDFAQTPTDGEMNVDGPPPNEESGNDSISNVGDGGVKTTIRLNIIYDLYPQETAWYFLQDGNTIESQTEITSVGQQKYNVDLNPGEASFLITDSGGDGLCCDYGTGAYQIYAESSAGDIELASSNGSFRSRETKVFIVPNLNTEGSSSETSTPENYATDGSTTCKDSATDVVFFVDKVAGEKNCKWLDDNMGRYDYLCQFVDVASKCPKLCDSCQYF